MFTLVKSGELAAVTFRAIAAQVYGNENVPSRARVNAAVNAGEPFDKYKDADAIAKLTSVEEDLVSLKREFPVPIDFSKFEEIGKLIRERRAARERTITHAWYVVKTTEGYFTGFENGKPAFSEEDKDAAPTQKMELVNEVEKRLKALGYRVGHDLLHGGRTMDEMLTRIEQFGFEPEEA